MAALLFLAVVSVATPRRGQARSGAVIRVIGEQRRGPVHLLGHDQPYQHVRQRQRPERPAFVGACQHLGGVPFRAADQPCKIAPLPAPVLQSLGQLLR